MTSTAQNFGLGAVVLAVIGGLGSGAGPEIYRDAKAYLAGAPTESRVRAGSVDGGPAADAPQPATIASSAPAAAGAAITVTGSGSQEARLANEIRPALVAALARSAPGLADLALAVKLSGLDFASAGARRVDVRWQAETASGAAACAVTGIRFVRAADLAERARQEIGNSLKRSEREGKMSCA